MPKYVVTLVKQSIFMLFAFSFKICLFVGKNQQCIQCRYTKSNPTCSLPFFMLQHFFPQNLFYKWKCTNKQNHNVQDVTPWACNGGRSPVLQGKGKVCVGRLQTLCFQSSVSTFTFPIRSLFLLHTSRHAHIWSLGIYSSARRPIQLREHNCPQKTLAAVLNWRIHSISTRPPFNHKVRHDSCFWGGILFFPNFRFHFQGVALRSLSGGVQTQFTDSRLQSVSVEVGECGCVNTVRSFMWAAICAPNESPAFSFRSGLLWHQRPWLIKEFKIIIRTTTEMRLGQQSGLCLSSLALPGYIQIKSPAIKISR